MNNRKLEVFHVQEVYLKAYGNVGEARASVGKYLDVYKSETAAFQH